jgi:aspartokinase
MEHKDLCESIRISGQRRRSYLLFKTLEDITLGFITANESNNYNYIYDQIVSKGEMLSTTILYQYLLAQKVDASFINARYLIKDR